MNVRITASSLWMPRGYREPDEARLGRFGPRFLPGHVAWAALDSWWLRNPDGANTPNWNLALGCGIEGTPGLLLVEAKAHVRELSNTGKEIPKDASVKSSKNHEQIGKAVADARQELRPFAENISVSRDRCSQLSNRLAFMWKLSSLGLPTILVYLGFCGDTGIRDVGEFFESTAHWENVFRSHSATVGADALIDRRLEIGPASAWLLVRARDVIELSPPADT